MNRTLLNRAALAQKLGQSVGWLYTHLDELQNRGFPPPVIGDRAGARWDPVAIDRWLDAQSDRASEPAELADWEARLDARIVTLPAGRQRR